MTTVKVTKHNNSIVQIECDGHTGYGVEGEDIVYAALSSIVQTAVLGLLQVAGVDVDLVRDDKRGYLKATIDKDLDKASRLKCDMILETMLLGVADINASFSDFVELEVR